MADIRPFRAYRPCKGLEEQIAALPYDVYSREEAAQEVKNHPQSFLAIDRPETQFDPGMDMYDDRVYEKAGQMLRDQMAQGIFVQEETPCFYLYQQIMDGRSQTGIVACASIDDYLSGVIRKHENTRADKEEDRIRHVVACDCQTGPVFLAYRRNHICSRITEETMITVPVNDFTSPDGITHKVWVIDNPEMIAAVREAFQKTASVYIADGHHRCASAVKAGLRKREAKPDYSGGEEFNYILAVLFPDNELQIMDYNRVVSDLNHLTVKEFLERIGSSFEVKECGRLPYRPMCKGSFGMYLDNHWYELKARPEIISQDPVESLDVSLLQKYLLEPVLGIQDPRCDKRIDFVGGIRGLEELERRVHKDMEVAFSLYPTSIRELFEVADSGRLMPPKSTWFEPKLRSGLFLHSLEG